MKGKRHIKSFNEATENLNKSDIWGNLELKKQDSDKDLIKSTDALTMTENDWNEKYPGLFLSKTDYHYYKKLGKSKYNIEKDDEPTNLGRFH
jgi:hypothetical protein